MWLWRLEQPLWLEDAPEVPERLEGPRQPRLDAAGGSRYLERGGATRGRSAPPAPRPGDAQRGQGWRIDVRQRLVIEEAAMAAAKAYYEDAGYSVKDVHREKPYDLCCVRRTDELHVEVKGTTSNANAVLLTAAEVRHARAHDHTALFVLGGLRVILNGDEPVAAGCDPPVIIDPWVPGRG